MEYHFENLSRTIEIVNNKLLIALEKIFEDNGGRVLYTTLYNLTGGDVFLRDRVFIKQVKGRMERQGTKFDVVVDVELTRDGFDKFYDPSLKLSITPIDPTGYPLGAKTVTTNIGYYITSIEEEITRVIDNMDKKAFEEMEDSDTKMPF
jgi:hypothetical protein|nr:MAG TPA: hypothetical protein [Caudoviricetes sp.]